MGLHDRDYVREKDFNYKKMEYSVPNSPFSPNNSSSHFDHDDTAIVVKKAVYSSVGSSKDIKNDQLVVEDSKNIKRLFFFVFFIIGVLVYFKN